MASNPPPSGPGQPWQGLPTDTPAAGHPTGGTPPANQWAQPAPNQWAQPAPNQWAQPQQPQQPPQSQWGQQGQWPPRPPAAQPQQGQWPPPAVQPPPPGQWGQQPQQGQWNQQPQQGQWGQQPQQGQWNQQPQQGQWGQQPTQWPPQQPPADRWAPAIATAGWGDPELAFTSDYPVDVRFTPEARIGRFWGILWIGIWLRLLLVIPHLIVLYVVGVLAFLATLLTWIPVLLTGRYPGWGYTLVGGYLRWATRVGAYVTLLSGTYPSFTGADREDQHVRVRYDQERPVGRFWGIPILGIAIRWILLIPHFIVLWLLGFIAWFLIVFAWIPVLVHGRQADIVYSVVGGWMRWYLRVVAYLLLLSGPYPPFRLD